MDEEELNKKIDDLRSKTSDIIESSLITIASYFPIASSFAAGWSEWKNGKQSQNIHDILKKYFERLTEIQDKVDKEYIKTEEAKRLLERTTLKGRDESREEKRKILADFLANSSTEKLSGDKEKDMILDVIDRLSPFHVGLLKAVTQLLVLQHGVDNVRLGSDYNPNATEKPIFFYIEENMVVIMYKGQSSQEVVEACLDYLVSVGLLEGATARGWTKIGGKTGIKGFRPTKLGLKTLEYLNVDIMNFRKDKIEL